ncbi:MAG: bifunctional UDP-sugar hydrolase/5'-nucleotidase [candidate division WOR-3 bacterium]|jgi:2',3'-cyclic-nucleotide 2'-phosphodiesterase (5'-nucleotidase family)|nr:bifunctional metallophosphatase/5'-nucleotidase [candidate division WOR-3 bacterium]MDH7519109.1 bifunctional UDP-sugar hydrolase/5'-nucleotidase [bacterium]
MSFKGSDVLRGIALFLILVTLGFSQVQHIFIVHTNDIHGALLPGEAYWLDKNFPPPLANASGAMTVIRELRDSATRNGFGFLLLDGGDIFKGTPVGDFTRGQAVVDFFRRAGYDAVAPGNHDFDMGWWVLKELVDSLQIPWVATNVRVKGTDTAPGFLVTSTIFERGGVKIGLLGVLTKYLYGMVNESLIGNLSVLPYYEVAREEVKRLRDQGADIVVALNHIGYSHDQRFADSVPGVDIIIGAHSHTGVEPPYESPKNHTIIQQAYSKLSTVGVLDISFDLKTRQIVGYQGKLIDLLGDEIPRDLIYARHLDSVRAVAEKGFDEVLGYCKRELTRGGFIETPAGNLITDAMRERFNTDIAIHNSAGIRANIPAGPVTYRHVYQVDVFGNTVVTGKWTGKQVKEMLEVSVNGHHAIFQVSGVKMRYTKKKPIGERVVSVLVNGEPLDSNRVYTVATNSYLAAGSGDYRIFAEGQDIEDSYLPLRDVIADYIRRHSPVDAQIEGRIVLIDH